jgi:glycine C-acetyltransferase
VTAERQTSPQQNAGLRGYSATQNQAQNAPAEPEQPADQELCGIGVVLAQNPEGELLVNSMNEGGPAARSNLIKQGDVMHTIDGVDVYFATFAKSMAGIGAFVASTEEITNYLRYNMRSQTFAKALPMPMVVGLLKRLELLKTKPELREKLWTIATTLQKGLKERVFDIGATNTMVTPVFLKGELAEATGITMDLRENFGIFCSIVMYPVIPKGLIELRIIPTAMHTLEDVNRTLDAFSIVGERLKNGLYRRQKA